MSIDRHSDRVAAAETVDEVIAFVEACLSTGEATAELRSSVTAARDGLQMISEGVRAGTFAAPGAPVTPPPAESGSVRADEIGHSMAAAMLRLARATCRRAIRDVGAAHSTGTAALEYLRTVSELLERLADRLDDDEARSVPLGMCVQLSPLAHRRRIR